MHSIDILLKNATFSPENREYCIYGWIKSVQKFNSVTFISVSDGSNLPGIQVVANETICSELSLTPGNSIKVKGTLVPSRGKRQTFELKATTIQIIGQVKKDFPLLPVKLTLDYLRHQQLVRHRTTLFQSVFEVRRELIQAMFCYFYKHHFFPVMAPILTFNSCEGGAELFQLSQEGSNFFKKNSVLLSVSGQFYCEAISLGLKNSFSFGPTFRAEKSNSNVHLAEFWMIEVEMAFTDLSKIIEFTYDFFVSLVSSVLKNCSDSLKEISRRSEGNENLIENLSSLINSGYKVITYSEGIEILKKIKEISWGDDLSKENEQYLCKYFKSKVLFITEFPAKLKPFYMNRGQGKKENITYSFDMLIEGVGELAGGSEREGSLSRLRNNIQETGLNEKELDWYLKLREYGYYSSAGFGLGFERLLMLLTGLKNIKDLSVFPRYYEHLQI